MDYFCRGVVVLGKRRITFRKKIFKKKKKEKKREERINLTVVENQWNNGKKNRKKKNKNNRRIWFFFRKVIFPFLFSFSLSRYFTLPPLSHFIHSHENDRSLLFDNFTEMVRRVLSVKEKKALLADKKIKEKYICA